MKKYFLNILPILIVIGCNSTSNTDRKTNWELLNLKGKVKSKESRSYTVSDYKFGEPIYELETETITDFNEYGYITREYTVRDALEKYENKESELIVTYLDATRGIVDNENYSSIYYNDSQTNQVSKYEYDTISWKLKKRTITDLVDNTEEFFTWEYLEKSDRISFFNDEGELERLTIETYDESRRNVITSNSYGGEGNVDYEFFQFYDGKNKVADSLIIYSKYGNSIYVSKYDDLERVILDKRIEYSGKQEIEGTTTTITEYNDNKANSGYVLKKYIDEEINFPSSAYEVKFTLDDYGNVLEMFKINLSNNKIEEATSNTLKYY